MSEDRGNIYDNNANFIKDIEELLYYSSLCNDEYGDYCTSLCNIARNSTHASDDLAEKIKDEVFFTLKYFKDNCIIQEETVTTSHRYEYLEWGSNA